ncbi:uncharacterized protein SCHCODRAFT_02641168 [Schizophyllum commune H4-8]|uniref:Calcium uniporter protein, mitochondrial n=1 Tax=Schizophyllum commune (strain H4-8 / FGSC 9210) TaxID=578458 RepID=D8QHP5_SCHCM|nr:uncharacterized protein SCHCODRAFT_02641168 [Schizophyllum commune H4-8]KAI5887277.1 hypothetical protein SCHCODRAFT_02641168 [Schizophyllum commune H4-8]
MHCLSSMLCRQRRSYASQASQELTKIEHSQFLSEAPPDASWRKRSAAQDPNEEEAALEDAADGKGKLLPTASHLFKLILPLTNVAHARDAPPVVFLLHPSQPLSHAGRLIASELMRVESGTASPKGGSSPPRVEFHSTSPSGKISQWSDSTDVADFMRDAARVAKFSVVIVYPDSPEEQVIDVQVPSFASRTRYLRRRLTVIESQLKDMDKIKRECDHLARRGARRMALGGFGLLVVYWGAVARLTFWDYGWDIMEPITYLSGLSTVICGYLWFLYQGREVSYTSVLDHSISSRREALYASRGLDIERYADLVAEARSLRREISKIAEDYDRDKWDDVVEDERGRPVNGGKKVEEESGVAEGRAMDKAERLDKEERLDKKERLDKEERRELDKEERRELDKGEGDRRGRRINKEDLKDASTEVKSESRRKVDEVTGEEDRKDREGSA